MRPSKVPSKIEVPVPKSSRSWVPELAVLIISSSIFCTGLNTVFTFIASESEAS
ncbi:hypothetical protein D9M68_888280 [compost metagenome]